MGIGSWPRPDWLLRALHDRLEGRLDEDEFQALGDRAVALVVQAQLDAGVDVVTDGEQRRDSYASFVGSRLENCQLIPIVDLLPYVEHPDEFAPRAAGARRSSRVGPATRRSSAGWRATRPGRWPCTSCKRSSASPTAPSRSRYRSLLAHAYDVAGVRDGSGLRDAGGAGQDIVRILRQEIEALLAPGAAIVQLDEPVLTEVVHGRRSGGNRSFMCGCSARSGRWPRSSHSPARFWSNPRRLSS